MTENIQLTRPVMDSKYILNWKQKFKYIIGCKWITGNKLAMIYRLQQQLLSIKAGIILRQQMLLVARGVGWNQSLCYWRYPGAELRCLSGVWIKCPYLVPPSMVRFNFRPITGTPCANTPAAANTSLLFSFVPCHSLLLVSFCIVLESDLVLTLTVLSMPLKRLQMCKSTSGHT